MAVFSCWAGLIGQPHGAQLPSAMSFHDPAGEVYGSHWLAAVDGAGTARLPEHVDGGDTRLPEDVVERILSFVPPIDQVTRYKVSTPGPKWFEAVFVGDYIVTFRGSVRVGARADVHVVISDERTDGRCPFPTFEYEWSTEVTAVGENGVTLARGAETCEGEVNYTIDRKVVRGRLQ